MNSLLAGSLTRVRARGKAGVAELNSKRVLISFFAETGFGRSLGAEIEIAQIKIDGCSCAVTCPDTR